MSIPLKWEKGDACWVRGRRGVVANVGAWRAIVRVGDDDVYAALSEIDLVPLPEPAETSLDGDG